MSNSPLPLVIEDMSAFAKQLRQTWPETQPSHAETLQWLARAAGYRNHQTLKAATPDDSSQALTPLEKKHLDEALRVFDETGQMIRWPQKTSVQGICLAAFWARLPARRNLTEKEVNTHLKSGERFGDHVLLRRALIEHRMVTRETDGSAYRRTERPPTPLERQFIQRIAARRMTAAPLS